MRPLSLPMDKQSCHVKKPPICENIAVHLAEGYKPSAAEQYYHIDEFCLVIVPVLEAPGPQTSAGRGGIPVTSLTPEIPHRTGNRCVQREHDEIGITGGDGDSRGKHCLTGGKRETHVPIFVIIGGCYGTGSPASNVYEAPLVGSSIPPPTGDYDISCICYSRYTTPWTRHLRATFGTYTTDP